MSTIAPGAKANLGLHQQFLDHKLDHNPLLLRVEENRVVDGDVTQPGKRCREVRRPDLHVLQETLGQDKNGNHALKKKN